MQIVSRFVSEPQITSVHYWRQSNNNYRTSGPHVSQNRFYSPPNLTFAGYIPTSYSQMWEWHFIFKSRLRRNDCASFFQVLTLSSLLRLVTCTTPYSRFLDLPSSDEPSKFWKWTTYIPAVCDVTSAEDRQRHTVYMKLLLAFVASSRNNEPLLSMRQVAKPVGCLGLPIPACWHTGTRRPAAWPSVRTQQKSRVCGTESSAVCVCVFY